VCRLRWLRGVCGLHRPARRGRQGRPPGV